MKDTELLLEAIFVSGGWECPHNLQVTGQVDQLSLAERAGVAGTLKYILFSWVPANCSTMVEGIYAPSGRASCAVVYVIVAERLNATEFPSQDLVWVLNLHANLKAAGTAFRSHLAWVGPQLYER